MSKNFRKFRDFEYDDDYNERTQYEDNSVRRKNKRIKNALRARNIDELLQTDDDY